MLLWDSLRQIYVLSGFENLSRTLAKDSRTGLGPSLQGRLERQMHTSL